jgi:hypothetical protein
MNTVFKGGPGLFSVRTRKVDPSIPAGKMRLYLARLEAIELDDGQIDGETVFGILFAQATNNPQVATALLELGKAIAANEKQLKAEASNV